LLIIAGVLLLLWLPAERGKLLQPSTRSLLGGLGLRNVLNLKVLHAYVYFRWTRQYISIALNRLLPLSSERQRQAWSDSYHGKVLTHDHARAIVTIKRTIPLRDLEQVIPYPTARDLVLNGPPDIVAYECVCRAARKTSCSPTQVCMIIGQPFANFILEHHPESSRRLTQAEALTLLQQEHGRGHVHTAWFKDVMLNRFYALCNCCSCCCGGLEGMVKYGMSNVASSGFVTAVDAGLCDGCGACEKACPFKAVSVNKTSTVRWERCMGCGVCEATCPRGAMSLKRDERKGIPFDVRMME
jgi:ferredoxin